MSEGVWTRIENLVRDAVLPDGGQVQSWSISNSALAVSVDQTEDVLRAELLQEMKRDPAADVADDFRWRVQQLVDIDSWLFTRKA